MKIKDYINKIVENGKESDMEALSEMLVETLYKIKETDKDCFDEYKMELFGMAYNYKFDKENSKAIVDNMKPSGEIWNLDTTESVREEYDINADEYEFYIVLNSMGNDFQRVIPLDNVETYAKMANAFINDVDAKEHKVWNYYTKIVEN